MLEGPKRALGAKRKASVFPLLLPPPAHSETLPPPTDSVQERANPSRATMLEGPKRALGAKGKASAFPHHFKTRLLSAVVDKKVLSERDICTKFITPAMTKAGWDVQTQIRENVH